MLRCIFLLLGACILAVPGMAAQIVEGHVTDAATGEGVSGVKVRIFPADGPPANGYSTTTDAQGAFRIEGVLGGAYRAIYSAPGFIPSPDPGDLPPAFAVPDAGDPVRLEVKLQPLARFSGRVLDPLGKPVPNAAVWLLQEEKWCMPPECHPDHRETKSGEDGQFTFSDLPPGPWLVAATAPPSLDAPAPNGDDRLGWAQTFFPGVIDPRLAQPVVLRPGNLQASTDIKLAATPIHHIRGRLLDPGGAPVAKASLLLGKGFGPAFTVETTEDGAFDFGVIDDQWSLSAAVDRNGVRLKCRRTVDLKDRDSDGIEMRLDAPLMLQGKIVTDVPEGVPAPAMPPVAMGLVSIAPIISDGPGSILVAHTDGDNLTLRDVYPDSYRIQFLADAPAPYYLDSIRLGDQDALGSFSVVSASLPLTVRFKLGGGTVRGILEACGSHHVFLVPQEPAMRRDGFIRIADCDPNGRFEFSAVRPGEYYGIAMAKEPHSFADLADDRVLCEGSRVTVRDNESTPVELRLTQQ